MIRYLNGDTGILKQGEKYTQIEELSGRSADMFVKADGSFFSSILATQTMQITGLTEKIKRYQLIQERPEEIIFKYEPFSNDLSDTERNHLINVFQKRLGNEFNINLIKSGEFVRSNSGKHRLMVNNLKNN